MPTLWTNLTGQLAVHEQCIAVVAPRTSEIDLIDSLFTADATIIKYVPVRDVLWCRGSGDIRVGLAEYLAVFEPSRRWAKDEIGSALDVAVLEVKACLGITCIDGVLMTQETAVDERQTVPLGMQGHSLSQSGGIILDSDIFQRNLAALNFQGKGAECSDLLGFATGCKWCDVSLNVRMVVPCDDGLVAVLTANLDISKPLRNDEFLLVNAFLDIDDLVVLHKGAADLNGFTYVTEFGSTVTCYKECVGIVVAFACSKSSEK